MITKFKIFENISPIIGDLVVIKMKKTKVYNNVYGKVINVGILNWNDERIREVLIRPYSPITQELRKAIDHNYIHTMNSINPIYDCEDVDFTTDIWMDEKYIISFGNDIEKFNKEIERIKIEKVSDKYNL